MARNISPERKGLYYIGMGLIVLGAIIFGSIFVSFGSRLTGFGPVFSEVGSIMSMMITRGFGGMALMIVGGIMCRIGARGLAGSGVVLDPEKARQDLEPYSRMAGGMVKDALDEAEVKLGGKPERVVMVKCPSCGKLNEEDSKFCQECGTKI